MKSYFYNAYLIIETGIPTPSQCEILKTEFDHVSLVIQSLEVKETEIEKIAKWLEKIEKVF